MYIYTLSLTSTLDGGGWSSPRPGRFVPGKGNRYLLYRRLGGKQESVWKGVENLDPHLNSNTKPSSPQRVAVSLGNDTAVQWC